MLSRDGKMEEMVLKLGGGGGGSNFRYHTILVSSPRGYLLLDPPIINAALAPGMTVSAFSGRV